MEEEIELPQVRVVAITKPLVSEADTASEFVAYVARVSNPQNQANKETSQKLLKYLADNNHWSPWEHSSATLEIKTTRDIARQLLRHRSFKFQEFSQRYAEANNFVIKDARRQDSKNRQNSINDIEESTQLEWYKKQLSILQEVQHIYKWALGKGIAKECARVILPEGLTGSTLYMTGDFRSWLHYLEVREDESTQLEHRQVALAIRQALGETEEIFKVGK